MKKDEKQKPDTFVIINNYRQTHKQTGGHGDSGIIGLNTQADYKTSLASQTVLDSHLTQILQTVKQFVTQYYGMVLKSWSNTCYNT